ncbi:hypothetical protein MesoLj131a_37270 [Mesorhizobium sp. 131-2-1]|nr:hypothetical protein MesoLj131a_37270 [Mesorhizobium sp. 131-2-1]
MELAGWARAFPLIRDWYGKRPTHQGQEKTSTRLLMRQSYGRRCWRNIALALDLATDRSARPILDCQELPNIRPIEVFGGAGVDDLTTVHDVDLVG